MPAVTMASRRNSLLIIFSIIFLWQMSRDREFNYLPPLTFHKNIIEKYDQERVGIQVEINRNLES